MVDRTDEEPQIMLTDVSVTTPDVTTDAPAAVVAAVPAPVQVRVPLDVPTRIVSIYIRQRENARLDNPQHAPES